MLPKLKETAKSRDMVQEFKGVNHNVRISDSEFYDMKNMTSDLYPALSPRKPRGVAMQLTNCGGLLAKDKLCYIEGDELHYGDVVVQLVRNIGRERQIISFGAYVIVFPDQIYLNTADTSDTGKIAEYEEQSVSSGTFELVDAKGDIIPIMYINGCKWIGSEKLVKDQGADNPSYDVEYKKDLTVEYLERKWTSANIKSDSCNMFGPEISKYVDLKKSTYGENYILLSKSSARKERSIYFPSRYGASIADTFDHSNKNVEIGDVVGYNNWSYLKISPLKDSTTINQLSWRGYDRDGKSFKKTLYIEVKGVDSPITGEYLLDCSTTPAKVKQWTGTYWKTVDAYIKITSTLFSKIDGKTDGVRLNNPSDEVKNTGILKSLIDKYSYFGLLNKTSEKTVLIPGALDTGFQEITANVDIIVKDLSLMYDYVIESQNRLWACRYGEDENGEKINKLYASALGDFKTWDKFDGTDADSYFVNLGTDGAFTGAINYKGYPVFFKENCIHRVYGNYPSQYQVTTDNSFGLQSGSAKSLQVLSGRLFFKAIDGIYAYDGANVNPISLKLGTGRFFDAIGGNVDSKYYVSMVSEEDGKRRLFVYDVLKDMWHVEDDINVACMERYNDNLYIADKSGTVYTTKDKDGTSKEKVEWNVESGIIGYSLPDSKYVSCMQIRAAIAHDAEMSVYIQYDSDGFWEYKGTITGNNLMSHTIPIQPKRCDHFKIKIEGKGECKVFSITKILENGGIV